jgi:hypothetical protein
VSTPRRAVVVDSRLAAPGARRVHLRLLDADFDANYKLNRQGSGEYVGRILPDAFKLHAVRARDLDRESLEALYREYLALPPAEAG